MRHDYSLSDETRKVLTSHVGRIADEMDVSDKHLYAILAGTKTDPFAMLVHMYAAAARAGAPVCYWRHKLDAIDARYEKQMPLKTELECLMDKFSLDADLSTKLTDCLKDGVIDDHEAERLQSAIDKAKANLDLLEVRLQFRREIPANVRRMG